ncbi:hypothetical protein IMG5_183920 [Ichthyophthirius multifiliis]|uniref:Cilia- and flagella-associated protein 91 n=1 Tax=Ichthyophthirius multifiliis TaxID=5932 RepID=G0R394_ICHMU|nr:hypothetical protein IMG5_183920 [Ichthyophthirius multifiliis]EGR28068.1 hypothetical protein IMG5_183920 [Ichthyophthirius multifiliis]|eukprot:XP_004027413.1 hypothetical protein IMG5_183920 [Ichthyophthirius multifiliis]
MSISYILQDSNRSKSLVNYISGPQRPLYFKRPLISQILDIPIYISQPKQKSPLLQAKTQQDLHQIVSKTRTIEIQTDYRESECQTDPYSPHIIVQNIEYSEVLDLQNLKWGKGLPCSILELDQIQYNRELRYFNESLPPISDEASFYLRRKLMEEQELQQWKKKEEEILEFQTDKINLLQKALIEREKEVENKNYDRLQEIKMAKTENKNRQIAKIQKQKIKIVRKMTKEREKWFQIQKNPSNKRNIIEEYANFSSQVYAAITHQGLSLDKIANKYEIQPQQLEKYPQLNTLIDKINPKVLHIDISIQKELKKIDSQYSRREINHKQELNKAEKIIKNIKDKQKEEKENQKNNNNNKYSFKNLKNKIRPQTPTWENNEENQNSYLSPFQELKDFLSKIACPKQQKDNRASQIIFLQKMLRGRSTQNIMYEGKKKRMALIEELLAVSQIENLPENLQEEFLINNHQILMKKAAIESIQGEIIVETLDQLSKELLRIIQQKKIFKMVQEAEKTRNLRQINEAGRRQAEEILRNRENVLHQQIMALNQGTVDTYLDTIMKNVVELSSGRQAIIMSNLRKQTVNLPLEKQENIFNNQQTIIKNLVHSFLIPDIQRQRTQLKSNKKNSIQKLKYNIYKVQQEEKKFSESAKKSLQNSVQGASQKLQKSN